MGDATEALVFVGVGALAYAAAGIDNLFLLLSFLGDRRYGTWQVVAGYVLGAGAVLFIILLFAEVEGVVPVRYLRFVGLVPLVVGLKAFFDLVRGSNNAGAIAFAEASSSSAGESTAPSGFIGGRRVLAVMLVNLSCSGDSVAAFAPLVAESDAVAKAALIGTFVCMTGLWLCAAYYVLRNRRVGIVIQRYGSYILPPLLIGLGIYIMVDTSTDLVPA